MDSQLPRSQPRQVYKPKQEVDSPSPEENAEMGFIDHLDALRWHVIRAFISIVAIAVIAFIKKDIVFGIFILGPKSSDFITYQWLCQLSKTYFGSDFLCFDFSIALQSIKPTSQFTTHIISSFVAGFIVAFPYVFWEIWRFVKPALYSGEKKSIRGVVFIVSFLFFLGVSFAYFVVIPFAIKFMFDYTVDDTVENIWTLGYYMSFITGLLIVGGLIFQLPVVSYFLSSIGIATPEGMKRYRKHAVVTILFVSAILTPPDWFTQIAIGVPIYLLYEVSIRVSHFVHRKSELS